MSADDPWGDAPSAPPATGSAELPEHLPPVEPPSAGFIVQLFVVPAIIVAIVIGVYLLFGRIAAGETDWRRMVSDIKSDNPNVRWRAALNLAEVLDSEAGRNTENRLSENPAVGGALNDLALELLKSSKRMEEEDQRLQFVLKALGRMDIVESTTPALLDALDARHDLETRKQALQAVAMTAGRQRDRRQVLDAPSLTDAVIDASSSPDPVIRQHAAYALGLIPGGPSDARLSVLLEDADEMTRINAAIAFAREASPRGLPVLLQALRDTQAWARETSGGPAAGDRGFERQLILKNALLAFSKMSPNLSASEKSEVALELRKLEEMLQDAALRLEVKKTRLDLESPGVATPGPGTLESRRLV